jgi:hypothetical protein
MTTDQFSISKRGLRDLKKFYQQAPKAFQRISAAVLTSMAVADYKQIPKTMDDEMTVRTPSLIKKATRFEKAKPNQPINKQQSKSGSIKTARHDAWEHVQTGQPTIATQFTDAGRKGGSSKGKAVMAAKAGKNKHQRATDYNIGMEGEHNMGKFIQAVARQPGTRKYGRRKPFFLSDYYNKMGYGIYKFVGGKVGTYRTGKRKHKKTLVGAKIKRISTPRTTINPRQINWKGKATNTVINEPFVKDAWIKNTQRQLNKIKPKRR